MIPFEMLFVLGLQSVSTVFFHKNVLIQIASVGTQYCTSIVVYPTNEGTAERRFF